MIKYLGHDFDLSVNRPHLLPQRVTDEEIRRLKEAITNQKNHKSSAFRNLVLVETAIKTGMRRSELANLLVSNINFESNRLVVVAGKSSKDRIIPVSNRLTLDLKMLCSHKQADEREFGFNYRSFGMKIKEWADKAGIPIVLIASDITLPPI